MSVSIAAKPKKRFAAKSKRCWRRKGNFVMTNPILNSLRQAPLPAVEFPSASSGGQGRVRDLRQRTPGGAGNFAGAILGTIAFLLGSALAGCANANAVRV